MKIKNVSVVKRPMNGYPWFPPFDPHVSYPEYPFSSTSAAPNEVYDMVRQALWDLELDAANRGTAQWNPLREFIDKGQTVAVKPNFVLDYNQEHTGRPALSAVVTDGSVLRATLDYVYKACGPTGRIVICETPLQNEVRLAVFNNVARHTETRCVVNTLRQRGVMISLVDLRSQVRLTNRLGIWRMYHLQGDPLGYVHFDLGDKSAFHGLDPAPFETNDWENVSKYHRNGHHLYSVSKTIMSAHAVINVPKLKVHKKTGLTVAIKNMFALSNRKDCIPHWQSGIDDKASNRSVLYQFLRYCQSKPLLHPIGHFARYRWLKDRLDGYGNWIGNDTTWRGVADLNRILQYGDAHGNLHEQRQRKLFAVVDGIIAGEGLGPLGPTPRPFGGIVAGSDPVEVDIACAQLMQLDPRKVKLLVNMINSLPPALTRCSKADLEPDIRFKSLSEPFIFHPDWESARLPWSPQPGPAQHRDESPASSERLVISSL